MASIATPEAGKVAGSKRLIVLCDGTWQDSLSSSGKDYPSNVTRISRALQPYADVDGDRKEQIIYYQKGLGTGTFDRMISGGTGAGLSANVRAAYGFLAHNYSVGDEIYFFGFSRGAYTARAIAGLVAAHGLLTKKGMDSFSELYNLFYAEHDGGRVAPEVEARFIDSLVQKGLIRPQAATAIQIVGVFDTVAFHKPGFSSSFIGRMLGIEPEYIEFQNSEISHRVKYGFHALSLDDTRQKFLPTMWKYPTVPKGETLRLEQMKQVWFSGVHTDVGGGRRDHRLSDISLGWMIAECKATGLLAFDESYFYDPEQQPATNEPRIVDQWDTTQGATFGGKQTWFGWLVRKISGFVVRPVRTGTWEETQESVHSSIADRRFGTNTAGTVEYKLPQFLGDNEETGGDRLWYLSQVGMNLPQAKLLDDEKRYRGHIRKAENSFVTDAYTTYRAQPK